jgi:chemotaxis protein CheD
MSRVIHVGIGELAVSAASGETLKSYALGSCIGVAIWDQAARKAGLLHVAYPESTVNPARAKEQPAYFVDTAIPLLISQMALSPDYSKADVSVRLAGGAAMMDAQGHFNIGKRNLLAVKRELWKLGFGVIGEDTGGNISRTVSIATESGLFLVANGGQTWEIPLGPHDGSGSHLAPGLGAVSGPHAAPGPEGKETNPPTGWKEEE